MASLWQPLHLAGNTLEYNSSLNADSFRLILFDFSFLS
jgi:hypothetical protein